MSPIFHLLIHQKMLTSTKFRIKYFTIFHFFLHSLVEVGHRITCFLLLSSMLLERVVTWQLLFTRRTKCRLLRTWLSMLLRNMITHLLFALCIKMTVWSLVFLLFFTSLSMSSCMLANIDSSRIFTLDYLISFQGRHYLKNFGTLDMFHFQ